MADKFRPCSRPGCNERGILPNGTAAYCPKHMRTKKMMDGCKRHGKDNPGRKWLDRELDKVEANGMRCPLCGCSVVFKGNRSKVGNVISLQHDNDGNMRLICVTCNVKHQTMGDSIYKHGPDKRRCNRCKEVLHRSRFGKFRNSERGREREHSYCRECNKARRRDYWKKISATNRTGER